MAINLLLIPAMATHAGFYDSLPPDSVLLGGSTAMLQVEKKLAGILATNLPVLLQGESGTGKNTLSRFIHQRGKARAGAYLRFDCTWGEDFLARFSAVLPQTNAGGNAVSLIADPSRSAIGMFFLHQVDQLSTTGQLELLRLLRRLEDHEEESPLAHARIVSASSRKLRHLVLERVFHRDLFHRIAVIPLELPPLRDRAEDLLPIANYLLERHAQLLGVPARPFSHQLLERMHRHLWPGNISELESFVCRYLLSGPDQRLLRLLEAKPASLQNRKLMAGTTPLKELSRQTVAEVQRQMMTRALALHQGNLRRAAETLGISYRTLIHKMDQAGLPRRRHFPRLK